jgi:uncharacterized protein (DUF305 family)
MEELSLVNSRILSIAVLALVALSLLACNSESKVITDPTIVPPVPPTAALIQPTAAPTMAMDHMGGMGTPVANAVPDDVTYIDMMIPHHQLAVDMAKIAQEKATHGELKGLANDIIRAQEDEIRRMGVWRTDLAGSATPDASKSGGMGGMKMGGMDVDLDKLKASPNFDRDFITAMIPHHQSAIDMSKAALPNLKHAPLNDMAKDVITTQQIEIERMNGWLAAWK